MESEDCFLQDFKNCDNQTDMLQQYLIPRRNCKPKNCSKANDYPSKFFDKTLQQFLKSDKKQPSDSIQSSQSAYEYPITIPYLGKMHGDLLISFPK